MTQVYKYHKLCCVENNLINNNITSHFVLGRGNPPVVELPLAVVSIDPIRCDIYLTTETVHAYFLLARYGAHIRAQMVAYGKYLVSKLRRY